MLISREKFAKIEEYVLYLFGIAIFLTEPCIKAMCGVVIILLVLRKILFKEKLFCGNEKLTKFLIWFLIIGVFWNFLAGMSYKPARNFIKMMRYIVLMFYVYPIVQRDREVLKKLYISCLVGFIILFIVVFIQYKSGVDRAFGIVGVEWTFEKNMKDILIKRDNIFGLGINTTALLGGIFGVINLFLILCLKDNLLKIIFILNTMVALFIICVTKSRSGLLAFSVVVLLETFIIGFFYIKNKLYMIIGLIILFFGFIMEIKTLPMDKLDRFKRIFSLEKSLDNISNNIRIEMLKIAIYRIKKHPVLGSGTKYDRENSFRVYANNMKDSIRSVEVATKELFKTSYDDAHNMYINMTVDNGLYIIGYLMIWFGIPFMIIKRLKYCEENDKVIAIAMLMGILSYEIQGLFWPIWRNMNQVLFWFILSIAVSVTISSKTENIEKNVLN